MNMRIKEYSFNLDKNKIGKKIQNLRKEKGYTAFTLAELLMYDVKTVNKWEQGRGIPDLQTLKQLTEILDINIDTLLLDNECIISKRFDEFLINDNLLSAGAAMYFKQFNPNIIEDIFGFRIRKDYLFQKYLDAFLSKEELLEVDILIANKERFVRKKIISDKIKNIVDLYKNNKYSFVDEALFEIEKLLLDSNKLEMLFRLSVWKKTNDLVYENMFEYLYDFEKDLLFNIILLLKRDDKYCFAEDLYKKGAKLNKKYIELLPKILGISKEEVGKKFNSFKFGFGFTEKFTIEVMKMLKKVDYDEYKNSYIELERFDYDIIQKTMVNTYE